MAGVEMGDRLLQLGCGDGRMFAALAAKVGLSGRALAIDEDRSACARAGAAAEKAGVFVEVETANYGKLSCDDESLDLVVLRNVIATRSPEQRVACLREVLRVLRPGGRCVVVEPAPRGGLGALFRSRNVNPHYAASGGAERALDAEGLRGVRRLAERDGLAFIEGAKSAK